MRRYTRKDQASRKIDEITGTPERSASSRVQGKEKMGRQDNRYNEFADDDEEEEDEEAAGPTSTVNTYRTENKDQNKLEGKKGETKKAIHPMFAERRSKLDKKPIEKSETFTNVKENPKTVLVNPDQLLLSTPSTSVSRTERDVRNNTSLGKLRSTAKEKTDDNSSEAKEAEEGSGEGEKLPPTTRSPSLPGLVTAESTAETVSNYTNDSSSKGKSKAKKGRAEGSDKADKFPPTSLRLKGTPSENDGSSRKSATFAEAAATTPGPKPKDHVLEGHTAIVNISIKVNKGEDPKKKLMDKVCEAVDFLRRICGDTNASILPIDHVGPVWASTKRIQKKSDFPKYIIELRRFFYTQAEGAFSAVNQPTGRTISSSALMFFSADPKELLTNAGPDLRYLGAGIYYKELQIVKTVSGNILLGAPMSMAEEDVEKELSKQLKSLEKGENYKGPYSLPLKVTKEHPKGMPWQSEEEKKKSKVPMIAKLTFVIHVSMEDEERTNNLLRELKESKRLHAIWGPTAFTVQVPGYDDQGTAKIRYHQMVQAHTSVQMSLGTAQIPGVVDLHNKYKLERLPDAEGPREDVEMSLHSALMALSIRDGVEKKSLFTAVVQGASGTVVGSFSSVDQKIKEAVTQIRHITAAQVYYTLLKSGCKKDSIKRFFRKVFSAEQNRNVSQSKYDKKTGLARVTDPQADDIIVAAATLGIDTELALSQSELKARREDREFEARAITFGTASAGDFEAVDPSEEQSVTSINTRRSTGTARSIAERSNAHTVYSICTENSDSENDSDEDKGSENETDLQGTMLFENLDFVRGEKEDQESDNNKKASEMKKEEADLIKKMMTAQMEEDKLESDDEEYEDTMQEEVDEEEEGANEDDSYSYDQEEMEVEAEVIVWDNEQEKRSKEEKTKTYRLIKATSVSNQIFNEAGPGLKEMQWKCEQIMSELQNMNQDNKRDNSVLSDKMLKLLAEEVDSESDYHAMHERMDELQANYALLYWEETMRTNDSRNEIIDNAFTNDSDEGTRNDNQNSNEYEEKDDMSELAERRLYGDDRANDKTDDEEDGSGEKYKEEEEEEDDNDGSKLKKSKPAEEGVSKRVASVLASALRPYKNRTIQKQRNEDKEDSGEQDLIHIRGGGSDGNSSDEEQENLWTEREKMETAKCVQGEPGSKGQKSGNAEKNKKMLSSMAGGEDKDGSGDKEERIRQDYVQSHLKKINIKEGEEEEDEAGDGRKRTQDEIQADGTKDVVLENPNDGWGRKRDGTQTQHSYRTKLGTWEMSMRILGTPLSAGNLEKLQKTNNMKETEDTGQETQARKTQGEVTLAESRAEND